MGNTSPEIALRFRLRALEDAEKKVNKVLVEVQKSKDITKEAKQQLTGLAREQIVSIRAQRAALENLRRSAAKQTGTSIGPLDNVVDPLRAANVAREKGTALLGIMQGRFGGVGSVLQLVGGPIAAAAAALVYPLINAVQQRIEEDFQARLKASENLLLARIDEAAFRVDYDRRQREEPGFRETEARRAFDLTAGEDAKRWAAERSGGGAASNDFSDGF